MRCSIHGTCSIPTFLADDQPGSNALAVDTTNVYWINAGTAANNYQDGALMTCAIAGCGGVPTRLGPAAANRGGPVGIAVNDTSVYWDSGGSLMFAAVVLTPLHVRSGMLGLCDHAQGIRRWLRDTLLRLRRADGVDRNA
jgi:hypothetical protein